MHSRQTRTRYILPFSFSFFPFDFCSPRFLLVSLFSRSNLFPANLRNRFPRKTNARGTIFTRAIPRFIFSSGIAFFWTVYLREKNVLRAQEDDKWDLFVTREWVRWRTSVITGQSRVYISYSEGIAEGHDHAGRGFEADSQPLRLIRFPFCYSRLWESIDRSMSPKTIY